jgi:hypothetical protein
VINTRCVDAQNDRENCGACLNRCDYKCQDGKCIDCPAGLGACFGECKNFANDNYNCGGCIRTVSPWGGLNGDCFTTADPCASKGPTASMAPVSAGRGGARRTRRCAAASVSMWRTITATAGRVGTR